MKTAFELRVPLSVFLGRDPAPDEPLWTVWDRNVAEAWVDYRDSLHVCGVPTDVAFDADNELVATSTGKTFRWAGEVNHCHVCAAADRARRTYLAQESGDVEVNRDGLIVLVTDRTKG